MLIKHSTLFAQRGCISSFFNKLILFYTTLTPHILPNCHHLKQHDYSKRQNIDQSVAQKNSQITQFGRCGSTHEAEMVFNGMPVKNIITWTALLTVYAENGQLVNARKVFDEMPQRNIASWNAMITGYVRNGVGVREACELFNRMPERNAVSYAAMITGFARAFMFEEAERLYNNMPRTWRDPVSSNALICGYLKAGELNEAFRVFSGMVEKDVVSWTSMVDGYCRKGYIEDARELFNMMPVKNVVSWTAMIRGHMKGGNFRDGFLLFLSMKRDEIVRVNSMTLTTVIEACANNDRYEEACQSHGLGFRMGFECDPILCNALINMYGKFGCLETAIKLFNHMSKKDIVSWNSMISSYVHANQVDEAYSLFQNMPRRDIYSWTTMIGGFCGKGDMAKSIQLFDMMPHKDDVAWTAVISGLVNSERPTEAIHWYIRMTRGSFRPNVLTMSSVISAAAGLANLIIGLQLHAHVVKMEMELDLSIHNSLVTMYSKCGHVSDAYRVFMKIASPNVISFNSMITGYAFHGLGQESLRLFEQMEKKGLEPNEITFLGVLSACTHLGLVQKGQEYFKLMKSAYHIEPGPDHYACMIDLLGRAGLLDQAVNVIHSMPFEPHAGVWGALQGAAQSHLRIDVAKLAAKEILRLEPNNTTPHVVLSKIFSILGEKETEEVRQTQKLKGKTPGCSWVLVTGNSN
ncbi:pentatricopeptide repeat-containing protein At1g53600, mitochondrial-like [Chenopodium quinoa]|nr:pentatricopeptide repeat-containing protein At1g53600, mitochondrial-like [Chenopodium quinoa]